MRFLVDEARKIIWGWSPKSGCTHIKRIFYYLTTNNDLRDKVHCKEDQISLYKKIREEDINNYKFIIIIRNPYKRIVSGFLEKMHKIKSPEMSPEQFIQLYSRVWNKSDRLTFRNFIDHLISNKFVKEPYLQSHFCQQTSHDFSLLKNVNSNNIIIYDLENINYKYIESLYEKTIPDVMIKFRGYHIQVSNEKQDTDVFDLLKSEFSMFTPYTKNFYDNSIKNKVELYYKDDFDFFIKNGYNYDIN